MPDLKVVLLPAALLLLAPGAHPQASAILPDAPRPAISADSFAGSAVTLSQSQSPPAKPDPEAASAVAYAPYEKRKWAQYVDPGEKIPALYPSDKWVFWLHEELRPSAALPAFISAGYGQLVDSDPKYGVDSAAFGERLGTAFLRQSTMRFFCSSAFPIVLREDPRYYRKASGGYLGRAGWAAERAFVTQRDDGSHSFNNSNIFGHLAASLLTMAYYPSKSDNTRVAMLTWGTAIAGSAENNLFLEFWPDVVNRFHRSRKESHAGSTGLE